MREPIVLLVDSGTDGRDGEEMTMSNALRLCGLSGKSIYSRSRLYFWDFKTKKWQERTGPDAPSHPFPPDENPDL